MAKYNKKFDYSKNKSNKDKKSKKIQEGLQKKLINLSENLNLPENQNLIKRSLKQASNIKSYSFYNELMLSFQASTRGIELEAVAAIGSWKKIDKNIVPIKGESALYIFKGMPVPIFEKDENNHFRLDKNRKKIPVLDHLGKQKIFMKFDLSPVFDVNQTNAKDIGAFIHDSPIDNSIDIPESYLRLISNKIQKNYGFEIIPNNLLDFNSEKLTEIFLNLGGELEDLDGIGEKEAFAYSLSNMFGIETNLDLKIEEWSNNNEDLTNKIKSISSSISSVINSLDLNSHVLNFQKLEKSDVDIILKTKLGINKEEKIEISDFDLI